MRTKIIILGLVISIFFALLAYIPFGFHSLSTPPINHNILIYFFLVSLGLLISYFTAYQLIKKEKDQKIFRIIVLFALIFSVILILIPPIGSADVFNYIFRARIHTVYGENPYLVATGGFKSDLFYNFSPQEWNYLPMQYGPLWTSISIGFSYLAQDSLFWNQLLYKLLALLINFGIIFFIWRILGIISPDYRIRGIFLYAWNPLILFEGINNVHNELLMIFFVVAAIYFFLKKKYLFCLLLLLFSVLIKYITILLFPVFLLFLWKEINIPSERVKIFVKAAVVLLIVAVLSYFPFWEGTNIFQGLLGQSKIASFMNLSLFPSFLFEFILSLKNILMLTLDQIMKIVSIGVMIVFALIYFWQLRLIKQKQDDFIHRNFLILFGYIIYAACFLQPWYFLWFLPLAVLINKKYFPEFVFLFTLAGLLSYTFMVMSIVLVVFFLALLFTSFFTKKSYFSPFLGFH
ncbi:MAG: hypothetical protein COT24_03700 [Candidatus Kerfeldbacteria bacterium CG08_land_8_20_14_0_20_40_16]|uniref:Glycosyltransferase RgtA/B/C/D-like domain-containing protein n=1 Tax=Candidatus Kerfeldbacteria bacterium CG08_land_8_20_14_0_20_40_16 TaxID=2014244 RepID=A0A2H0YXE3_9BACT|nr:MAG: hypothetical protein COT24_03700 [Candidatus Kerfeldbacteria bacterium CG08_land_8_20_14_0_20_40_16]